MHHPWDPPTKSEKIRAIKGYLERYSRVNPQGETTVDLSFIYTRAVEFFTLEGSWLNLGNHSSLEAAAEHLLEAHPYPAMAFYDTLFRARDALGPPWDARTVYEKLRDEAAANPRR